MAQAAPRPDGRRARGEARRAALLDAALHVLADGGAASLTHRAVAAAAGASPPSVLYHFETVAELRRATFLHAGELIRTHLGELLARADDPEAIPRVAADLAVTLVTEQREAALTYFEMTLAAGRDAELRATLTRFAESLTDLLTPYSGSREPAELAASAWQGRVLTALAAGEDLEADRLRADIGAMVACFAPRG